MEIGSIKRINKRILWIPLIAISIFWLWLIVSGVKMLFFTGDQMGDSFGRLMFYFIVPPLILIVSPIMWFLIIPKKQKGQESEKSIPDTFI